MRDRDRKKLNKLGLMVVRGVNIFPQGMEKNRYIIVRSTMENMEYHETNEDYDYEIVRDRRIRELCESESVIEDLR